jgi:hypothetical protein
MTEHKRQVRGYRGASLVDIIGEDRARELIEKRKKHIEAGRRRACQHRFGSISLQRAIEADFPIEKIVDDRRYDPGA